VLLEQSSGQAAFIIAMISFNADRESLVVGVGIALPWEMLFLAEFEAHVKLCIFY